MSFCRRKTAFLISYDGVFQRHNTQVATVVESDASLDLLKVGDIAATCRLGRYRRRSGGIIRIISPRGLDEIL
jgi:hypothetical protein